MPKQAKRILSVTIKRMIDDSPDTSYYGEYGNSAESEYAIDREHSLDCQLNTHANDARIETIERVIRYLDAQRIEVSHAMEDAVLPDLYVFWYSGLEDAETILQDIQYPLSACDCDERGDRGRNELRYFNPNWENYKEEPEAEIRRYCRQDYERMESLNRCDWGYIGISAEAMIQLGTNGPTQRITSGGLWGIESDSGEAEFTSTEDEELSQLRDELHAMGFSKRAIATAVKNLRRDG